MYGDIDDERHPAEPWYRQGLRFECIRCGRCCRGGPGLVWVSPEEIEDIAGYLGLREDVFRLMYLNLVEGRYTLADGLNGDCFMLDRDTGLCKIYEVRPEQCRSYPFWPELLERASSWAEEMERCPGIDKGHLWTLEEIRKRMPKNTASALQDVSGNEGAFHGLGR